MAMNGKAGKGIPFRLFLLHQQNSFYIFIQVKRSEAGLFILKHIIGNFP